MQVPQNVLLSWQQRVQRRGGFWHCFCEYALKKVFAKTITWIIKYRSQITTHWELINSHAILSYFGEDVPAFDSQYYFMRTGRVVGQWLEHTALPTTYASSTMLLLPTSNNEAHYSCHLWWILQKHAYMWFLWVYKQHHIIGTHIKAIEKFCSKWQGIVLVDNVQI